MLMREVICADSIPWLEERINIGAVVTSLPDADEMGLDIDAWLVWFIRAVAAVMRATSRTAPAIFYQTDRKASGAWHSKAALLFSIADDVGLRTLWHKIVCRREPGSIDLRRPGYSHLIAFSVSCPPGRPTADVLPAGRMIYPNAMGLNAAFEAVRFAIQHADTVCDPFCGRGTVLAVAEALGVRAIGLDIDDAQVNAARQLRLVHRRETGDLALSRGSQTIEG